MTIRLYSSLDVGAPQMGIAGGGDMIDVLRGCLVTGYGTRTPQGWTMPFSDLPNNKACFQGVSGLGDYIRVNDNYDYRWCEVNGFATMSSVDVGTGMYPNNSVDLPLNNVFKFYKRGLTTSDFDNWFLLSDDEWFYYFGIDKAQNYPSCGFFGKYECVSDVYSAPYAIGGIEELTTQASYSSYGWHGFLGKNEMWQRRNEWDDIDRPTELIREWEVFNYIQPNPLDGKLYFEKVDIRDVSNAPYVRWGQMPNYFRMLISDDDVFATGMRFQINTKNYVIFSRSTDVVAFQYDLDAG
jgi:hypothetical protein